MPSPIAMTCTPFQPPVAEAPARRDAHRAASLHAALAACVAALVVLAGCGSTPVSTPSTSMPVATTPQAVRAPASSMPGASAQGAGAGAVAAKPLPPSPAQPPAAQAVRPTGSVFFDFDDATVAPSYSALVESYARWLVANTGQAVRVEGNTDERGSSEYNLALGQKRAEAVRRSLVLLGVNDQRIEAVSWGRERPRAIGHDEAAWAQNRRVDITDRRP